MNAITKFATLDWSALPKHGTAIAWTFWPGYRGETLTTIRGCKWAKYFDAGVKKWVYYDVCKACYAQNTAHSLCTRFPDQMTRYYGGLTKPTTRGPIWTGKINFDEQQLLAVLTATKPRAYFLTSMGDLFYDEVSDEIIAYHVAVMIMAHWHLFLVLSKRPDRMARLWNSQPFWVLVVRKIEELLSKFSRRQRLRFGRLMAGGVSNVWMGASIESQASANWALGELMKVPSTNLWTSFEPMLEYVDLSPWMTSTAPLHGDKTLTRRLKWVVFGGPSKQGPDEAPDYRLGDAYRVINDCAASGIASFQKQLGANPTETDKFGDRVALELPKHNNHNADPRHWPSLMRVQQFPVPA